MDDVETLRICPTLWWDVTGWHGCRLAAGHELFAAHVCPCGAVVHPLYPSDME
jgi:hypothetical protein